jgi:enamine deaminase RidA (YjgF/YER057c/UK114 family)
MEGNLLYAWAMQPTEKLSELGIVLPSAPKVAGLYKPVILDQNLLYFSGHLPLLSDGGMITGKLGADFSTEKGKEAARLVGVNILASVIAHLGSIDRVDRVVKLLGMVNAVDSYTEHPLVINGCSELFKEIWGEDLGVGVRSAYGVSGLPGGAAVEIEGILKIKE